MASLLDTLKNNIVTSIYGRRLGLTKDETLVGPKAFQSQVQDLSTASSATAVPAYGVSRVTCTGSTQGPVQYLLDAPIPGVEKTLVLASSSTGSFQFLSTSAGAAIYASSLGTTVGVVNLLGPTSFVKLIGLTTAIWGVVGESLYGSTALAKTVSFTTST